MSQKYKMLNCEEGVPPLRNKMKVSASVHAKMILIKMKYLLSMKLANKGKRKKSESHIRDQSKSIGDSAEYSNDSDMSMSPIKSLHDFNEKMDWLYQSHLRKACTLRRQIELSHTRKEIRQSRNSAFTPSRPQKNWIPEFYSYMLNSYKSMEKRYVYQKCRIAKKV